MKNKEVIITKLQPALQPTTLKTMFDHCWMTNSTLEFPFSGETKTVFMKQTPFIIKMVKVSKDGVTLFITGTKSDRIKNKWTNIAKQILKQQVKLEWLE